MAESKISPHNLNDLKNTTDDALGNYLRGLSFQQDNSKLDVRLALGYVSVIIAGVIFYADWKLGWEATKGWTAVAVAAYAVLNGAFTYWMWAVEKGLVFEGSKNGKKVRGEKLKSRSQYYCRFQKSALADHFPKIIIRSSSSPPKRSTIPPITSTSQRPRAPARQQVHGRSARPTRRGSRRTGSSWPSRFRNGSRVRLLRLEMKI
jgi:hypothetical protein